MWLVMAFMSALFAGLTSILAKGGIKETEADGATAVRTVVVLVFSWIMVFITGSLKTSVTVSARPLIFLILSGIATGASWICYFKALSTGDINKVVPIDKSSTILTVIFAVILFKETNNLSVKIIGTFLIAAGTLLMIEKKDTHGQSIKNSWLIYALLSAVFAALTSILAKIGVTGIDSNLATAIRTSVVLIMAWLIVIYKGKTRLAKTINPKELKFILLSGFATGASWLCYYYAIQNGIVSVVVPIYKLSIIVSIVFSYFVFNERLSKKAFLGLSIITVVTLLMAVFR